PLRDEPAYDLLGGGEAALQVGAAEGDAHAEVPAVLDGHARDGRADAVGEPLPVAHLLHQPGREVAAEGEDADVDGEEVVVVAAEGEGVAEAAVEVVLVGHRHVDAAGRRGGGVGGVAGGEAVRRPVGGRSADGFGVGGGGGLAG